MNRFCLILISVLVVSACKNTKPDTSGSEAGTGFSDQRVAYAQGFSMEHQGNNTLFITVKNPWQHASGVEYRYLLSDTLTASHKIDAKTWALKIPVKRVICLSTTHIGFIAYLNRAPSIIGISGKNYAVNEEVRKGISQNQVVDVGYDENLNYELILRLKPDVVFAYGVSVAVTNTVKKLEELGIPVLLIGEYLEQEPVAKMEWIKVFAASYDLLETIEERFDSTVIHYNELKSMTSDLTGKPSVLLGLPWSGSWYISGSHSYVARLIADAGGYYLWDHLDFNESRPMRLEEIYEKALTADYWLNPGEAQSKRDIIGVDERFSQLPAMKNDRVFNNNNLLGHTGGNAFFESGVVEPDIILSDIIAILHPQLLPSYRLKYYRKLNDLSGNYYEKQ